MAIEQHVGELIAAPAHGIGSDVEVGDVATCVDIDEDTVHFTATTHRRYVLGQSGTDVPDLGKFALKSALPVCYFGHYDRLRGSAGSEMATVSAAEDECGSRPAIVVNRD